MEKNKEQIRIFIKAFLMTWAMMRVAELSPGNIITGVIFVLAILLLRHTNGIKNKEGTYNKAPLVLSIIYALIYVGADYINILGGLENKLFKAIILIAVLSGLVLLFYNVILLLFYYLKGAGSALLFESANVSGNGQDSEEIPRGGSTKRTSAKITHFYVNHAPLCTFLICIIAYLPYFLYLFPGVMTPDSIVQLGQVVGYEPLSNHHPMAHTFFIGLFYRIGHFFTENNTIAISFYTVFQMFFMAFCASYLIKTLILLRVKTAYLILSTLFYALVPYNAIFSVTIWKDVPFAGIVLIFVCALIRTGCRAFAERNEVEKGDKPAAKCADLAVLIISGAFLCIMRSNGWYAFLLCTLVYIMLNTAHALKSGGNGKNKLKTLVIKSTPFLISIIIAIIIKYPVMSAFSVEKPDFVETISIPLQQVAAVITFEGNISPNDMDEIKKIADINYVNQLYEPTFADNIKELVRAGNPKYLEDNKGGFLKLYLRTLIKNPAICYRAYVEQTKGYYFPSRFYNVADTEGVAANAFGIEAGPIIGGKFVKIKEIFIKLGDMLPIYSLLWSMGTMLWMLLFFTFYAIYVNQKSALPIFLPYYALILTVLLATPVAAEFRYVYFLMYSLPLFPAVALRKR